MYVRVGNVRVNGASSLVSRVNRHAGKAEQAARDLRLGTSARNDLRLGEDLNANARSATGSFMERSRGLSGRPINGQSKSSDLRML